MLLCTAQEIVDALHSSSNVSVLELKGNTLGVNAAKAIGHALEQHSDIKVINTAQDNVSYEETRVVIQLPNIQ